MTLVASVQELNQRLGRAVEIQDNKLSVKDVQAVRDGLIEDLVHNATLAEKNEVRNRARWIIWELSQELGCPSSSIHELYMARSRGEYQGTTVPAINIRALTYEFARTVFRTASKLTAGPFIFEIAKSEIGYTLQRPAEYTAVVLGAAIKEGYVGPVFLQGDHFQFKMKSFKENRQKELDAIKALTKEAIEGGFYNIDIDSSTLVDLSRVTVDEQQRDNYEMCAEMTAYIRSIEPKGITISVGGEIGEVGEKNSTVEEFEAFYKGYQRHLKSLNPTAPGISKISIQTGSSHGGVPLADGSIADVKLDFDVLKNIGEAARHAGLGGAVQHGASTLPDSAFDNFPKKQTLEVHLATGFQNLIYDSQHFPKDLKDRIYAWLSQNLASERKSGQTAAQFYYKTRKQGFGPFKQELWHLSRAVKDALMAELEGMLTNMFRLLGVAGTRPLTQKYIHPKNIHKAA